MEQTKAKLRLVAMITLIILTKSTTCWKEETANNNNVELVPDFVTLMDEQQKICNSNVDDTTKECQYLMSENIKDYSIKRKLIEASNLPLKFLMNGAQETDKNSCSCGMDYRLADLGYNYFPRYVPTGVCKKDGCRSKYSKCSPRTYKVHVLKRRESDEAQTEQTRGGSYLSLLPDGLKNAWTVETVKVNVACHCAYS